MTLRSASEWDSLKEVAHPYTAGAQVPAFFFRRFPNVVHPHRPSLRRPGLTLMELVVVMFILMALAAILVPLFPSLIERAHRSSQATNESELTKAVQLYQGLYGSYPDGYDLLTDGTNIITYFPASPTASPMLFGETAGTMPNNVYNQGWTFPCGGYVTVAPLTTTVMAAV